MRKRRVLLILLALISLGAWIITTQPEPSVPSTVIATTSAQAPVSRTNEKLATTVLEQLAVKGRAPKTGYTRTQFGDGWQLVSGCDTRNIILHRDLVDTVIDDKCKVVSGTLNDPYTGTIIQFTRGANTSSLVQIDHVVALSNAWQTGAQALTAEQRIALANDPLELLAVDGDANQKKGDSDAATWLPANKAFRCQYVTRQIAVKQKYNLWVTLTEKLAMQRVLDTCPTQALP